MTRNHEWMQVFAIWLSVTLLAFIVCSVLHVHRFLVKDPSSNIWMGLSVDAKFAICASLLGLVPVLIINRVTIQMRQKK
jgi:hypothetical protein